MIKGAIEAVTPTLVSGWIYSSLAPLRDALILAFSNGVCIGTGTVSCFRQDLADAGLDDGYLGFSFPIGLPNGADIASVVVRLDGAEAVLLQPTSRVGAADSVSRPKEMTVDDMLRRIRWLRRRNVIAGAEYDILRGLARFGVYEVPVDAEAAGAQMPEDTATARAKKLLELTALNEVVVKPTRVTDAEGMLDAIRSSAGPASGLSHVIIWSAVPTRIGIVEGGHLGGPTSADTAVAVDYHLEPSNLLVVHVGCAIVPRQGAVYRSIVVMSGSTSTEVAEAAPGRAEPASIIEEPRVAVSSSAHR